MNYKGDIAELQKAYNAYLDWHLEQGISKSKCAAKLGIPTTTFKDRVNKAIIMFNGEIQPPKILLFDLETSYIFGSTFDMYDTTIYPDNVCLGSRLLSAQWRWLGEKKVHIVSQMDDMKRYKKNKYTFDGADVCDMVVAKAIAEQINEADIVIAHNAKRFDMKKLNSAVFRNKLPPLKNVLVIDTLAEAKKLFKHESNSLDALAKLRGIEGKLETSKGMFRIACSGNAPHNVKAYKELLKYGGVDIEVLEEVYLELRPYMKSHPNMNLWYGDGVCGKCGSKNIEKSDFNYTASTKRQSYLCECGNHGIISGALAKVKYK